MTRPTKRTTEFYGREDLAAADALAMLGPARRASFSSEMEYRDWFVREAMHDLVPQITGSPVRSYAVEAKVGARLRIDVLAVDARGVRVGFEAKCANLKNPQTARHHLIQGIGQTLLYHDALSAQFDSFVPVYLVSDIVPAEVAALMMRHALPIGVVEANEERIVCVGRAITVQ